MDKHSPDFMLGEILARLGSIDEKLSRLLFRADQLEERVEELEKKAAKTSVPWALMERGSLIAVAVLVTYLLGQMGIG